jgi:hypothetical protein
MLMRMHQQGIDSSGAACFCLRDAANTFFDGFPALGRDRNAQARRKAEPKHVNLTVAFH